MVCANINRMVSGMVGLMLGVGSDVVYLNALGNDIVIVNSDEAARTLLEKRSAVYSDRCVAFFRVQISFVC